MTLTLKSKRQAKPASAALRRAKIDAVFGKYAHVPTSSDRIAREKKREIELEDRRK